MMLEIFFDFMRDMLDDKVFRSDEQEVKLFETKLIYVWVAGVGCDNAVVYCFPAVGGIALNIRTHLEIDLSEVGQVISVVR